MSSVERRYSLSFTGAAIRKVEGVASSNKLLMHNAKECYAGMLCRTDANPRYINRQTTKPSTLLQVRKHYTEVDLPRSANQTVFADSPDVYKHYCNTREELFSSKVSGCGIEAAASHPGPAAAATR